MRLYAWLVWLNSRRYINKQCATITEIRTPHAIWNINCDKDDRSIRQVRAKHVWRAFEAIWLSHTAEPLCTMFETNHIWWQDFSVFRYNYAIQCDRYAATLIFSWLFCQQHEKNVLLSGMNATGKLQVLKWECMWKIRTQRQLVHNLSALNCLDISIWLNYLHLASFFQIEIYFWMIVCDCCFVNIFLVSSCQVGKAMFVIRRVRTYCWMSITSTKAGLFQFDWIDSQRERQLEEKPEIGFEDRSLKQV